MEKRNSGFKELSLRLFGITSIYACIYIFYYHERLFLSKCAGYQTACACSDPFRIHSKAVKTILKEISLEFTKSCANCGLLPGKKLYYPCYRELHQDRSVPYNNKSNVDPEASDNSYCSFYEPPLPL